MAGLADLDFSLGLEIEKVIFERFNCLVSSQLCFSSFTLVASFGRSAVKLNENPVALLLQSCIGESAKDFHVAHFSG